MMEERSGGEEEEDTRGGKKGAKEVREEIVTTCGIQVPSTGVRESSDLG